MIWQVTVLNCLQKPLAFPAAVVLIGEAVTAAATTTLAIATAVARLTAASPFLSAHFYICNTERCENQNINI